MLGPRADCKLIGVNGSAHPVLAWRPRRGGAANAGAHSGQRKRPQSWSCSTIAQTFACQGQSVLYVTERCVFALHGRGIELLEVAPGIGIECAVLALMGFVPLIEREPRPMDPAISADLPMGLRTRLLLSLADRFTWDAASRTLLINFERLLVRTADDVEAVRREIESRLAPLGEKVNGVVNFDHYVLDPQFEDAWTQMVRELVDRHYLNVVRYTTSGFLRAKRGPALAARGVGAHLCETTEEARRQLCGGAAPD
jgi:propionate CoA-transferase